IMKLVDLAAQEENSFDSGVEDEVGQAESSFEREILFELSDKEKTLLENINRALRKIDEGNYGACESCGEKITDKRMEALPHTRYCMKCASLYDRG
ncbi:MAG TPA: TraR/DksA C4-type zinc finger protein, partial [bacterium]|nr:TraR/DksA C4-type zinc finger protein [bacterium]